MDIVVSGIRPTGRLHLGNYLGAVKNFVEMQNNYNCFFFIADWHALTTHTYNKSLKESIKTIVAEYLACGIDPEKVSIYLQSDVPQVAELYLLLNMHAYLGELERTTSFKEKARKQPQNVNAGLLTYPVLMAADIIIHKAKKVPVGEDQKQNLEMVRKFAKRFNGQYKHQFFPLPKPFSFSEKMIRIPGLDGSGKMGKSRNNGIYLFDSPDLIRKKVMSAVTDSGPTEENQPKPIPIQNLFTIMKIVSSNDVVNYFNTKYNTCTIRYGDLKKQLTEDINSFIEPIRQRISELSKDDDFLEKVLIQGAERAKESAENTLKEVRKIMGFNYEK